MTGFKRGFLLGKQIITWGQRRDEISLQGQEQQIREGGGRQREGEKDRERGMGGRQGHLKRKIVNVYR